MIGVAYTPAGQQLGLSGTSLLVAPQYTELLHTLLPAARHVPAVAKQLPDIVNNYTKIPKEQLHDWQTIPERAFTKLQCSLEEFYEPHYLALRHNCSDGFTNARTYAEKFRTLAQIDRDGNTRQGIDFKGELTAAIGLQRAHDRYNPRNTFMGQGPGFPYRVPNFMARRYTRPETNSMLLPNQEGPAGQGHYNAGNRPSEHFTFNTVAVQGHTPLAVAQQQPHADRDYVLQGPIGNFTASTTAETIDAEQETVSVEPHVLDDVLEIVSTMEKKMQLRPVGALVRLRRVLKPFKFKAHLDDPSLEFSNYRTTKFPYEIFKQNLFSPIGVRRKARATQFEAAVHFCNYVTSYEQFKCYMLR